MLDQSSQDAIQDSSERSLIWRMLCLRHWKHLFYGKELLRKFTLHQNTGNNPTMNEMFDMSEKLIVGQSDEIYGVNPINWEDYFWKTIIFGQ